MEKKSFLLPISIVLILLAAGTMLFAGFKNYSKVKAPTAESELNYIDNKLKIVNEEDTKLNPSDIEDEPTPTKGTTSDTTSTTTPATVSTESIDTELQALEKKLNEATDIDISDLNAL